VAQPVGQLRERSELGGLQPACEAALQPVGPAELPGQPDGRPKAAILYCVVACTRLFFSVLPRQRQCLRSTLSAEPLREAGKPTGIGCRPTACQPVAGITPGSRQRPRRRCRVRPQRKPQLIPPGRTEHIAERRRGSGRDPGSAITEQMRQMNREPAGHLIGSWGSRWRKFVVRVPLKECPQDEGRIFAACAAQAGYRGAMTCTAGYRRVPQQLLAECSRR
jgi:hypothetical protein